MADGELSVLHARIRYALFVPGFSRLSLRGSCRVSRMLRVMLANCCSAPANRRRCRACGQAGEGVVGYQIGKAEGLKALLATTLVEQGILVSRHYAIAEVPTLTDWEFPVEPHRARHRRICRVPQVGGAGRSGGPAARRSRGRAIRGGDRADPDLDRYGIGKIRAPRPITNRFVGV